MRLSQVSMILLSATAQALPGAVVRRTSAYPDHWNVIDVTKTPEENGLLRREAAAAPQFIRGDDSNKCGGSTFNTLTSDWSAQSEHCQCIFDNLKRAEWKGKFYARPIDGSKFGATAVVCLSCAFVVTSPNDFGTNVGTEDVMDLIRDSISRFGRNNRIGAKGDMECENDNGRSGPDAQSATTWSIEHVPN